MDCLYFLLVLRVLVAQWIERSPPKRQVAGSTPAGDVFLFDHDIEAIAFMAIQGF